MTGRPQGRRAEFPKVEDLLREEPKEMAPFTKEEEGALRAVQAELRAWDGHDLERLLALFDERIVYHDVPRFAAKGRVGVRALAEERLAAVPDLRIQVERFVVEGNSVASMGRLRGTLGGGFRGRPGDDRSVECLFCQVAIVENGKLKYVRDYWDSAALMRATGRLGAE
jgi:ketosteroid isomerase-like protein